MKILKVPGQGRTRRMFHKVNNKPVNDPYKQQKRRVEYRDPETGRTRVRWTHARPCESKRSDIGMPYLNCDRVEYQSTVTGEMITSGAQHREHLKKHDLVEMGTENMQELENKRVQRRAKEEKEDRLTDILETYDKLEQGQPAAQIEETTVTDFEDGFNRFEKGDTDFMPAE